MAFKEIISMSFGKTSSHRLLVGGRPASSCTLDEIDVGFGTRVILELVYGSRRRRLQFERRHVDEDPKAEGDDRDKEKEMLASTGCTWKSFCGGGGWRTTALINFPLTGRGSLLGLWWMEDQVGGRNFYENATRAEEKEGRVR
jgi:hypothetical protein